MMTGLKKYFPILEWLPTYGKPYAVKDLVAAAIVTIMLVPQSLAYAMLAGLPAHIGLYASILPLVAYAIFGTSRTLAVGPVAVVSLMTAAALGKVAVTGSPEYLAAAVILAMMSGLVLVIMGLLRLGFIANFLSHQVISGFITASGILIATSQLKHILGVKSEGDTLPDMLHSISANFANINPYTLAIGVISMAFLFWVRKQLKPLLVRFGIKAATADLLAKAGPVLVIVLSILAVIGFDLAARGVKLVGVIPSGMPPFAMPVLDYKLWSSLLPAAVLISLVGFVESISIAQTLAAKSKPITAKMDSTITNTGPALASKSAVAALIPKRTNKGLSCLRTQNRNAIEIAPIANVYGLMLAKLVAKECSMSGKVSPSDFTPKICLS